VIKSILIVGAGWTGRQIAAQCAAHGVAVRIHDTSPAVSLDAKQWAFRHAAKLTASKLWSANAEELCCQNIALVDDLHRIDISVGLCLECVPESPALKRKVLRDLSTRFGSETIVASNSSYFTPSMLVKYVDKPERFAHFHFHSPIWLSTVVDIVPAPQATSEVVERLREFAVRIGQTPFVQRKENSGYVFNDILRSILTKSLELAERGIASPEEIESSWKTITGMRVGPFGMMDWIGIDLVQQAFQHARFEGDYEKMEKLVSYLQPWIDRGELGVKTSKGFLQYDSSEFE
jgi:3-hydroxybutyryl-CoA dehydrogenase